ncbi:MAG: hypothetical protein WBM59_13505 [Sedimenticolaceae bacterium]
MLLGALLWARDIRRRPQSDKRSLRGPWIMAAVGAAVFLFYLWLVTHGLFEA